MMNRNFRRHTPKLTALILIPIIALATLGITYSHWQETLTITGTVTTGKWKACVRIWKTLDGAFTNPETGADLTEPNRTHIAIAANFTTKFKLTIYVQNCESTMLTNVFITDRIELNVAPINSTPSKGTVSWVEWQPPGEPGEFIFNYLTWNIGELAPGESADLVIWIRTLKNPQGKYAPTSGDEGDAQDLEINRGATVVAESPLKNLSAATQAITLLIGDDDTPNNGIGIIVGVKPDLKPLPYTTPWAEDRYP